MPQAPGRYQRPVTPNSFAAELGLSAKPDYANYDDFATLDVREQHVGARQALAAQIYEEEDVTRSEDHWDAYNEPIGIPERLRAGRNDELSDRD
jgi:hypothetical protein